MAFRFRLDEPIEKGFRRIGAEQIERARKELAAHVDPATEVHESRKCLKRIRALLRLGRAGLGEAVFRTENARFRSIAAVLAPARDDHVLLETIVKLEAEAGDGPRSALARLKAVLFAGRSADQTDAAPGMIEEARAGLERALRRFRRLRLEPNDFSVLAEGLTRCYRRGLKGLDTAYAEESDEAFHELRKSVQTHWRQMALLSRTWPAVIEARVEAARELSQMLGEDHDLALLKARLASLPAGALPAGEADEVAHLIGSRQGALRAAAEPRGRMIFAERAKAHGRWIAALWEAAVAKSRADLRLADLAAPKPAKAKARAPAAART